MVAKYLKLSYIVNYTILPYNYNKNHRIIEALFFLLFQVLNKGRYIKTVLVGNVGVDPVIQEMCEFYCLGNCEGVYLGGGDHALCRKFIVGGLVLLVSAEF